LADGDHRAAIATAEQARELSRDLGYRFGEMTALNTMGEALLGSGAPAQAQACHEEAHQIAAALGARPEEACALEGMGRCDLKQGRLDRAAGLLTRALAIYRLLRSPCAERVAAALAVIER
jgi:Tfp pilus assembly protein PilF